MKMMSCSNTEEEERQDTDCETEIEKEFYKKKNFINSKGARIVRIVSEFIGIEDALKNEEMFFNISVFGSARSLSADQYKLKKSDLEKALKIYTEKMERGEILNEEEIERREKIKEELRIVQKLEWTTDYYNKVSELSKKLISYFNSEEGQKTVQILSCDISNERSLYINKKAEKQKEYGRRHKEVDWNKDNDTNKMDDVDKNNGKKKNIWNVSICTGGGPGFMEAANKGSKEVGGKSMGLSIALPSEEKANPYVDNKLSFKFHYFFTRKFWMFYLSIAFIIFPGGYGTLDEFLELMNLRECKKIKRDIPIILFGKTFWEEIVNFKKLAEYGLISESSLKAFYITNSVDAAFNYIITRLTKKEFPS